MSNKWIIEELPLLKMCLIKENAENRSNRDLLYMITSQMYGVYIFTAERFKKALQN